jgi:hypothetical protein
MSNTEKRAAAGQMRLLFVLLAIASVAGVAFESLALADARSAADAAARDLTACRTLAARIGRLRDHPPVVGTAELDHAELAGRIERAAARASIPAAALLQITPGPGRRVGETNYVEKPTAVAMAGVGLRQLVVFMQTLALPSDAADAPGENPALTVRDLRLSPPPGQAGAYQAGPERWSANLTLVYRIYSPRTSADHRGEE